MNKDDHYTLTIYVAAPGTPLNGGGSSLTGHMYLVTRHGEETASVGLQPDADGRAVSWMDEKLGAVPAGVSGRDLKDYKDPYYARTMEISKEQYDKIQEFGADPSAHGFDMKYHAVSNSCTDFAWAAMKHAGIHDSKILGVMDFEGDVKPTYNVKPIQMIKPPFPDSDLNTEHFNEMPAQNWRQKILSENEAPTLSPERAVASGGTDARHSNDPLFSQINQGVARLDAEAGRTPDATSENVSASLYALAKANDITRVDHVLLSERTAQADAAQNIFIVQGERNDPAHLRASMATAVAAQTPADASFERAEQLTQAAQVRTQEEQQHRQVQEQSGPRMV